MMQSQGQLNCQSFHLDIDFLSEIAAFLPYSSLASAPMHV